LGRQSFKM